MGFSFLLVDGRVEFLLHTAFLELVLEQVSINIRFNKSYLLSIGGTWQLAQIWKETIFSPPDPWRPGAGSGTAPPGATTSCWQLASDHCLQLDWIHKGPQRSTSLLGSRKLLASLLLPGACVCQCWLVHYPAVLRSRLPTGDWRPATTPHTIYRSGTAAAAKQCN